MFRHNDYEDMDRRHNYLRRKTSRTAKETQELHSLGKRLQRIECLSTQRDKSYLEEWSPKEKRDVRIVQYIVLGVIILLLVL